MLVCVDNVSSPAPWWDITSIKIVDIGNAKNSTTDVEDEWHLVRNDPQISPEYDDRMCVGDDETEFEVLELLWYSDDRQSFPSQRTMRLYKVKDEDGEELFLKEAIETGLAPEKRDCCGLRDHLTWGNLQVVSNKLTGHEIGSKKTESDRSEIIHYRKGERCRHVCEPLPRLICQSKHFLELISTSLDVLNGMKCVTESGWLHRDVSTQTIAIIKRRGHLLEIDSDRRCHKKPRRIYEAIREDGATEWEAKTRHVPTDTEL